MTINLKERKPVIRESYKDI